MDVTFGATWLGLSHLGSNQTNVSYHRKLTSGEGSGLSDDFSPAQNFHDPSHLTQTLQQIQKSY